MRKKDYPKQFTIGNELWKVRFVRKFEDQDVVGECDPSDKEIRIKLGMSFKETLKTLIHEVLHALESDLKLRISHKQIYRLEKPLFKFIRDNFL